MVKIFEYSSFKRRSFTDEDVEDVLDLLYTQMSDFDLKMEEYPLTYYDWFGLDIMDSGYYGYQFDRFKHTMAIVIMCDARWDKEEFRENMNKLANRLSQYDYVTTRYPYLNTKTPGNGYYMEVTKRIG